MHSEKETRDNLILYIRDLGKKLNEAEEANKRQRASLMDSLAWSSECLENCVDRTVYEQWRQSSIDWQRAAQEAYAVIRSIEERIEAEPAAPLAGLREQLFGFGAHRD